MKISLRAADASDEGFLYHVYAGTRADELAAWGWNPAQQEAFLRMQFNAQHQSYGVGYAQAGHHIILADGQPAGRLLVNKTAAEMLLVDIALLPEYRGAGIGSALIKNLLGEGAESGRPVCLQVLKTNVKAVRLYERLGFAACDDDGMYLKMKCQPASAGKRPVTLVDGSNPVS